MITTLTAAGAGPSAARFTARVAGLAATSPAPTRVADAGGPLALLAQLHRSKKCSACLTSGRFAKGCCPKMERAPPTLWGRPMHRVQAVTVIPR